MILEPGVHVETNTSSVAEAFRKAKECRFRVFDVDLRGTDTKQALLARLKAGLSLPDYFGANWDALEECLRDLQIEGSQGVLLVLRSADALLSVPASDRHTLTSILSETARFWEGGGVRFCSVLVGSPVLAETIASAA